MGEERSSRRKRRVGFAPAATSCEPKPSVSPAQPSPVTNSGPEPTAIAAVAAAEDAEMPVQLPTISRSMQLPVWQDGGRKGHPNLLISDPGAPMNGNTTFQADYVHHNLPPIPDLRPKVSALVTTADSAPFVPHTEHRDNYAPFSMPRVRYRTRRGQIQIPKVPLESSSSYKSEYILKVPERRAAYVPREQDTRPTEPFTSTSLYADDFRRWDSLPCIGLAASAPPVAPAMRSAPAPDTTDDAAAADTVPDGFEAGRSLQGATDYRGNFRAWPVTRTATVAPMFRPPKEAFATETSYAADFGPRERQPERTRLFRPPENDLSQRGPFNGVSLYMADFVPKEARPSSRQIYENRSSLMYPAVGRCGLETWYPGAETQPYLEHPLHVFYRA